MIAPVRLWQSQFPNLAASEDPVVREVLESARFMQSPAGSVVFESGQPCDGYLLVLGGSVRVQLLGVGGREVVLYRVQGGQACVLTTSCLLSGQRYPASGIVESEVSALYLPRAPFERGLAESVDFRRFVFDALSQRLVDVLVRVEEVALESVEVRLARTLVRLAGAAFEVRCTHQQMAAELGTAREVVSRTLARFAERGWVESARGRVALTDVPALRAVAAL